MPKDTNAAHVENVSPKHEALLTGAIALASLFSNCVEAFGLIHPSSKWDKAEQLLLTRLGLQQARLLIWGSVVGVASPPATVTDRAVPKRPSLAYPDLNEPTFFDARDSRLDDPEVRMVVEQTLSTIVDRSSHHSREEMMAKYGLKPPKRFGTQFEPALDSTRLESFREKYELLREVAESYAQINTRRNNSLVHTSWMIADVTKFGSFIKLTQEMVDSLIALMDVKEKVDRAMRMDIRIFGWHIVPDRNRATMDISKLRLLQEICKDDYPEYMIATQQALDNISREARENAMSSAQVTKQQQAVLNTEDAANGEHHKKRPSILKLFKAFGRPKDEVKGHSRSLSGPSSTAEGAGPQRSQSETPTVTRVRSKSIGAETESAEGLRGLDDDLRNKLEKMAIHTTEPPPDVKIPIAVDSPVDSTRQNVFYPPIERHDQYHGIGRTATKDLHQGDY